MAADIALHVRMQPAPRALAGGNPLLVLLHGYGSNELDLLGLAQFLDDRLGVASVRAPIALDAGGFAWFELAWLSGGIKADLDQAAASQARLLQLIPALRAQLAPSKLFLGGFSQGAMMAAAAALAEPSLADGIVLMSGAPLPGRTTRAAPPAILTHGAADPVLPLALGQRLRDTLTQLGGDVSWHQYAMGHEISEECLEDINTWLVARME